MIHTSRRKLTGLAAAAALSALSLLAATTAPVAGRATTSAAPAALTAVDAVAQVTGEDGVMRFDVAEDGKRFVWGEPKFDDGYPAPGSPYISFGYIYPDGTLSDEIDGVNADGTPEFPDKVLGDWYCYGWFIGEGAQTTEGPWVVSTQLYNFGGEWGAATLTSEGYVLSETGGTVMRAITGGTGQFASARGEMADTGLGFNETEGWNARYEVTMAE